MTALFLPLLFNAEDAEVLFEGRVVSPAKRALIKSHLARMGSRTEDVPTLRLLDSVGMSLIAASVAAVNQARLSMRVVSTNTPPPRGIA